MEHIVIAYIPVLHKGYLKFLEHQLAQGASQLWLVGDALKLELEPQLRKDIRALSASEMVVAISQLFQTVPVKSIEASDLTELPNKTFALPDEDLSHVLVEKYLQNQKTIFLPTSLRWDSTKTLAQEEVSPDEKASLSELEKTFMQKAKTEAEKSIDWWRRVGAVAVKDGKVLFQAHNEHVPSSQEANYKGDPRGNFHKGVYIELSVALHAEANIITQAAKQGVSLEGADLFVSVFPCPTCSKLIAQSGFRKLYFAEGYSMVDGAEVMRSKGIQLIKVAEDV